MHHGDMIDGAGLGDSVPVESVGRVAAEVTPEGRASGDTTDCTERIVVGVDFSPASLNAGRWAVRQLAPASTALFTHVVPWPDGPPSHDGETVRGVREAERPYRQMRPALLGGLAGFAASLRLARTRSVVRLGRPSAWLATLAESEHADLLVLGRRKDAARHRIGEPNVIERVARRAPCAVLVVPEETTAPVEHVIAAVDASPAAEQVVARALRVARVHRAALTLVHVLSPWTGSYDRLLAPRRDGVGRAERVPASEVAHRDAMYARLAWLARDAGPEVACRVSVPGGDAGREIIDLVRRSGPSVVVVGKRGADADHPGRGTMARRQ
ncbi:UspA domain-containing protein (plasmid) [Gemmatirosa kalamazoonensis]|uniref:UspA domain-containing protein n=1 Tax=Gemmatirosa kalamazoonensis TaxID=861299 RepID=W0RQE8_9BACT|nr:universal stress protein [Gemmatirosa kalamazoonensis]AHG93199.1 UspA domain-containing protein [Gemmatirosa kalamazoonensis]